MIWGTGAEFGARRTRNYFCYLPRTYGWPKGVTVWLEWVQVEEEYVRGKLQSFWVTRLVWRRIDHSLIYPVGL